MSKKKRSIVLCGTAALRLAKPGSRIWSNAICSSIAAFSLMANPSSLDPTPDGSYRWLAGPNHRFLSAGLCRQTAVSPLRAEMLKEVKFRHPKRRPFVPPLRGADAAVPRSMSSSSSSERRGIGMAAEGDSLTVSAARLWISSDLFSPSCRRSFAWPRAIDLTTSPLQMGQVLRRLTSQGVLTKVSKVHTACFHKMLTCSLRGTRARKGDS